MNPRFPDLADFYLFANLTNLTKVEQEAVSGPYAEVRNWSNNSADGSIWNKLPVKGAVFPWELSLSFCLATFDAIDTNITALSPASNTELAIFDSVDDSSSLEQISRRVVR